MACLNYKPSQVMFDSKIFERSQLIEAQGHLLYLALEQMQHLDFDEVERSLLGAAQRLTIQPDNMSPRMMRPSPSMNYSLLGTPSGAEGTALLT